LKAYIKIFDILIILIAVLIIAFSFYTVYARPSGRLQILIQGQEGQWIFPIDAEETVFLKGPLGDTKVRLSGKYAWVESSPCDNQNCVASGKISRHGQWAACLPNNVILLLNNTEKNDVDSVTW